MKENHRSVIGSRISFARKDVNLSQSDLSERIGITRSRLASYEEGRGCLRCGIAFDICRNLVLSEQWLATGEGNKDLYLDVALCFPAELLGKPFLEMYDSHIKSIYQQKTKITKGKIHFLWSMKDHPETLKLAFYKLANLCSNGITDALSLVFYWGDLASHANFLGDKYSAQPRLRHVALNKSVSLLKNGEIVPFSYERFYDDLALLGLTWVDIEPIADMIADHFATKKAPIPTDQLKALIFSRLKSIDPSDGSNTSKLYEKIYLKEG